MRNRNIVLVGICCLVLCGCKERIILKKEHVVYEYGTPISYDMKEYVQEDTKDKVLQEGVLQIQDSIYDVGTYTAHIIYKKQDIPFTITIKDTKKPVFDRSVSNIVLENGTSFLLQEYFHAYDLVGSKKEDVKLSIDKQVDTSVAGKYERHVIAMDKNNNTTSKKVIITVLEKKKEVESTHESTLTKTPKTNQKEEVKKKKQKKTQESQTTKKKEEGKEKDTQPEKKKEEIKEKEEIRMIYDGRKETGKLSEEEGGYTILTSLNKEHPIFDSEQAAMRYASNALMQEDKAIGYYITYIHYSDQREKYSYCFYG